MRKAGMLLLSALVLVGSTGLFGGCSILSDEDLTAAKPVIYLYPEQETEVTVKLDYSGRLTTTYPLYERCWEVTAMPDGTLTDKRDGREYAYLFWEGKSKADYDLTKGFVVKGAETREFLQEILPKLGLIPKEYNDFIVYWLPKMEPNPYNLITFQTGCYTESAKLTVTPEPDSLLRVFMAYRPLSAPVEIEPPVIEPFERKGFTVVEWGGCEIV